MEYETCKIYSSISIIINNYFINFVIHITKRIFPQLVFAERYILPTNMTELIVNSTTIHQNLLAK